MSEPPFKAQVAGLLYPENAEELRQQVNQMIDEVDDTHPLPRGMIVPHGGYIYSGMMAAKAYKCLEKAQKINRVILFAPAHRFPFSGIATHDAPALSTPLGEVPIDKDGVEKSLEVSDVSILDLAFIKEHALEVHLPFLQVLLKDFSIVPFIVGDCHSGAVFNVLESIDLTERDLVVISSDLSHYQPYSIAQEQDIATGELILSLNSDVLNADDACGFTAINGLIDYARLHKWQPNCLGITNSGDTAGEKDKVVGYGVFHFS